MDKNYIELDDVDISTNEKLVQFLLEDPIVVEDSSTSIAALFVKFKKHGLIKFKKINDVWLWIPLYNFKFSWKRSIGTSPFEQIQIDKDEQNSLGAYTDQIEQLGELSE